MEFSQEDVEGITIVVLGWESLDPSNSEDFKSIVSAAIERNSKVVLDMSQQRFIDSSGFGALLSCQRQARAAEGDLKLCGLTENLYSLFQLIRMHRVFEMFSGRDEAIKAFQTQSGA